MTNNSIELNQTSAGAFLASKRGYTKIAEEKRLRLLRMIQDEQLTIKTAALRLGINYSTAKNIVKIFRCEKRTSVLPKKLGGKPSMGSNIGSVEDKTGEEMPILKRFVAKKTKLELDTPTLITSSHSPALAPVPAAVSVVTSKDGTSEKKVVEENIWFDFTVYGPLIVGRYNARQQEFEQK